MAKYIVGDIFEGSYPVTQVYGANPTYYAQFGLPGHEGVDFCTPTGTPILAPFDGIILRDTVADKDYGNFTVVWDPVQKCAVWFCHLLDMTTQVGDKVVKGDVLGHTNNTGNTTGPHLHINFVETDAQGNRLNMDNGYQGFLDILDPNLVDWDLSGKQTTAPVSQSAAESVLPPNYDEIIGKATKYDQIAAEGFTDALTIKTTIDNLTRSRDNNQKSYEAELANNKNLSEQINELQGEVKDLTTTNNGLKTNISEVQKQNGDLLIEIADAKKQLADYNKGDSTAIDAGIKAQQENQQLTASLNKIATTMGAEDASVDSILAVWSQQQSELSQSQTINQNQVSRFEKYLQIFIDNFIKK